MRERKPAPGAASRHVTPTRCPHRQRSDVDRRVARARSEAGRAGEDARRELAYVREVFEELGASVWDRLDAAYAAATLERLADEPETAEAELRTVYESFRSLGRTTGRYALVTAELADVLYDQGRFEEARKFVDASAAAVSASDIVAQAPRQAAEAKLLVRHRDSEAAVASAGEAVVLMETTDMLNVKGRVLSDLGEVLLLAARPDEASRILVEAARLYDQQENLPSAERARRLAEDLTARARGSASL